MQAIQTKYIPATNTKPSRVKAWCTAGSLIMSYSTCEDQRHASNEQSTFRVAAEALAEKLGWTGPYYGSLLGGTLPDNKGYCWVFNNQWARD